MIVDIHAHLWFSDVEQNKRNIIKACGLYGISRVYISCLGGRYHPYEEDIKKYNLATFEFMKEYPELIGGFCYINPHHEKCVEYLKKGIEEYGMSGLKLLNDIYCDDPKVFPLIEKSIDFGIPILVHSFVKTFGQGREESVGTNVVNLAAQYPEAKIIMAHFGGNCYHGIKAIKNCRNVWSDFCGSTFRRDDIDYAKEQIGVERILYGTDMPDFMLDNIGQVEEADLTEEEKELIYYKNALKLLDTNYKL